MTYRALPSAIWNQIGPDLRDNGYLTEVGYICEGLRQGREWLNVNADILCALGTGRGMTSGSPQHPPYSFIVKYLGKHYEIDLIHRSDQLRGVRYDRLLADLQSDRTYHLRHYAESRILQHLNTPDIRYSDIYLPYKERTPEATVGLYAL